MAWLGITVKDAQMQVEEKQQKARGGVGHAQRLPEPSRAGQLTTTLSSVLLPGLTDWKKVIF